MLNKVLLTICTLFILQFAEAQQLEPREELVEINGTKLFVQVMGKGDPLVLVHGGPGLNHTYLEPWLENLASKYTLIFYDQRGMGASQIAVSDSMRTATFVRDLEGLREYLGIEQLYLMAHSFGCFTGYSYICNYPDRVKAALLVSPVPFNNRFDKEMQAAMEDAMTEEDRTFIDSLRASQGFAERDLETVVSMLKFSANLAKCDPRTEQEFFIELPENYFAASISYKGWRTRYNEPMDCKLIETEVPITVLHGQCDVIPLAATQEIPIMADIVVFEESGHYSFMEQPKAFKKLVRKTFR